jgi:hypothetical protein
MSEIIKPQEHKTMHAVRQIIEDPQDVIAIPPEFRHRRTEVIFMALEPDEAVKVPRANWFKAYQAEKDVDVLASLPIDEATEDWEW